MIKNIYFSKIFLFIILCLSFHIIASIFSIGFYSDDEHFQILEPVAYLMGINEQLINDPTYYYWEWNEGRRIRPLIQIYFYFYLIKPFEYLQNPFLWSFILRFISSLIGFFSLLYLFFTFYKKYNFNKNSFNYFIFFCFWFYPFLHSRTSSENLSLSIFILGLCLIYNYEFDKKSLLKLLTGVFLIGIAVDVRFNLIFSVAPLIGYLVLKTFNFLKVILIIIAFISALAICIIIDSIFWGFYTNTFLQFYHFNMGPSNFLNSFGIEPWWYYITETIISLSPLLSLIFLFSIIYFWFKKPFDYLTIITFFHFIILSYIGHKEIRYIFPLFIFAPFFIIYLIDNIHNTYLLKLTKSILIISNLIFLFIALLYPLNSKVGVYKYLYTIDSKKEIFYYGENPYQINNMEPYFYTKFLKKIQPLENNDYDDEYYLITNDFNFINNMEKNCELKYSTIPRFLFNINSNWKRLKLNWEVLYCN